MLSKTWLLAADWTREREKEDKRQAEREEKTEENKWKGFMVANIYVVFYFIQDSYFEPGCLQIDLVSIYIFVHLPRHVFTHTHTHIHTAIGLWE